jgi:predicted aspartyl protease
VNAVKTFSRFCIVLFAFSFFGLKLTANPRSQMDPPVRRGEVPFKIYGGFLIVMEGRIGDRDKLKFVLDTGVTHSVMDRKLAERLAVERRAGKILNFDKAIPAEWAEVPFLQFGPIEVNNFSMMLGDLRYFQSYATHVDAVIGLDLLRLSSFSIDYDAHKVSFSPVDNASGVPMSVDPLCLSVQVQVGDSKVWLLLDTGAQALIFYEDRVANRLPQLRIEGETAGTSMGGSVLSKKGFLPKARLGSTDLGGIVFLVKAPPSSVLSGIDGYLGTAALKARRIDFDFATNTFAWKK